LGGPIAFEPPSKSPQSSSASSSGFDGIAVTPPKCCADADGRDCVAVDGGWLFKSSKKLNVDAGCGLVDKLDCAVGFVLDFVLNSAKRSADIVSGKSRCDRRVMLAWSGQATCTALGRNDRSHRATL
jgi:hypothetical protein